MCVNKIRFIPPLFPSVFCNLKIITQKNQTSVPFHHPSTHPSISFRVAIKKSAHSTIKLLSITWLEWIIEPNIIFIMNEFQIHESISVLALFYCFRCHISTSLQTSSSKPPCLRGHVDMCCFCMFCHRLSPNEHICIEINVFISLFLLFPSGHCMQANFVCSIFFLLYHVVRISALKIETRLSINVL